MSIKFNHRNQLSNSQNADEVKKVDLVVRIQHLKGRWPYWDNEFLIRHKYN